MLFQLEKVTTTILISSVKFRRFSVITSRCSAKVKVSLLIIILTTLHMYEIRNSVYSGFTNRVTQSIISVLSVRLYPREGPGG